MMRRMWSVWSLVVLVGVFGLAGCGGGGNGDDNTVTLSFRYPNGSELVSHEPLWVAFQDGDEPWQAVEAVAPGVYRQTVTDPQGRYGFITVTDEGFLVQIIQATLAEARNIDPRPAWTSGQATHTNSGLEYPHVLSGTVTSDVYDDQPYNVYVGNAREDYLTNTYEIGVPAGSNDIAVRALDTAGGTPRLYLARDVQVQGQVTHDVHLTPDNTFALEEGFARTCGPEATGSRVQVLTANGTFADLPDLPDRNQVRCYTVPARQMRRGDVYVISAYKYGAPASNLFMDSQTSRWYIADPPAFMTIDAPPAFSTAHLDAVEENGSYYPIYQGLSYPDASLYRLLLQTDHSSPDIEGNDYLCAFVTAGWLKANGLDSYRMPDFSEAAGWNLEWGTLISDEKKGWAATAVSTNNPIESLLIHPILVSQQNPKLPDGTRLTESTIGEELYQYNQR